MNKLATRVQVNITFRMLMNSYLNMFIELGLNPEILIDWDVLDNFSKDDYKKIASEFADRGSQVTFHGPFMDISPASGDPEVRSVVRKRFKQLLEIVPVFKPATVVCHSGYDRRLHADHKDEWLERSVVFWSWLGKELHSRGSMLVLENVFEENPEELTVLLDNLHCDHVGFCLDTGHQQAFGKVPLQTWIDKLGDRLLQVHLHDNYGEYDDHLPLGEGVIDFKPLIDFLKNNSKKLPIITLEPHREEDFLASLEQLGRLIDI